MQALQFRRSVPRYLLLKLLGKRLARRHAGALAPLCLRDLAEPKLPAPDWVRIAPLLSGICGSDLSTISASGSPYLAPLTSMPFVMGHETVGRLTEIGAGVKDFQAGDRVTLKPALGCRARGIDPLCPLCETGRDALCRNVTRGVLAPGVQTGYCRDTGGAWSESFVAHQSQVYKVPDEIDDQAAVLLEPFACAVHAALAAPLAEADTALVLGCGAVGLLTIAALRALGCPARIVAVARHEHQREWARELGADELLEPGGSVQERSGWARTLEAEVFENEIGKPAVVGGASVTFDCVASGASLDTAIRFTRSGGTLVLVGMPGVPRHLDWTPLWYQELTVKAVYTCGGQSSSSRDQAAEVKHPAARSDDFRASVFDAQADTFALAIGLLRERGPQLARLVGPPHSLDDYRAALTSAFYSGESQVVKTVFGFASGR